MKALVVYESMWGNTRHVAEAVARGIGDVGAVDVEHASSDQLEDLDLLVLGGPTHAFSMTRSSTRSQAHQQGADEGADDTGMREWLDQLPSTLRLPIATFDTRAAKARHLPGSAAKAAGKELHRHHHADVIDRESFFVDDTAGPLLEGELERAESWGRTLAARLPTKR